MKKSAKTANVNASKKSSGALESHSLSSPLSPKIATDPSAERIRALEAQARRLEELNENLQKVNAASVENVAELHKRIRELELELALERGITRQLENSAPAPSEDDEELAELEREDATDPSAPFDAAAPQICDDDAHPLMLWLLNGQERCMRCGNLLSPRRAHLVRLEQLKAG